MNQLELIRALPKAELHVHIEGTFEPELMFAIAQRNQIEIPYKSVEEVKQAYNFHNLQSFLDIYYSGANVLVHEQDFYDLAWAYFEKCAEDQVVHTEMFFDPQTHTDRGIAFATVINGLQRACDDAQSKLGISSRLIMCFLRHLAKKQHLQRWNRHCPIKSRLLQSVWIPAKSGIRLLNLPAFLPKPVNTVSWWWRMPVKKVHQNISGKHWTC